MLIGAEVVVAFIAGYSVGVWLQLPFAFYWDMAKALLNIRGKK